MLKDLPISEFSQKLSSSAPTPGGGSAAALAGWLASSLLLMFCRLSIGKEKFKDHEAELKQTEKETEALGEILKKGVDEDTEAFNQVMEAFKLPKETEEEKEKRRGAIQKAMRQAAEVPLAVSQNCLSLLKTCHKIVDKGNPNSISDLGVACLLAYCGLEGALLNVKINLASIKDEDYAKNVSQKIASLKTEADDIKSKVIARAEELMK